MQSQPADGCAVCRCMLARFAGGPVRRVLVDRQRSAGGVAPGGARQRAAHGTCPCTCCCVPCTAARGETPHTMRLQLQLRCVMLPARLVVAGGCVGGCTGPAVACSVQSRARAPQLGAPHPRACEASLCVSSCVGLLTARGLATAHAGWPAACYPPEGSCMCCAWWLLWKHAVASMHACVTRCVVRAARAGFDAPGAAQLSLWRWASAGGCCAAAFRLLRPYGLAFPRRPACWCEDLAT